MKFFFKDSNYLLFDVKCSNTLPFEHINIDKYWIGVSSFYKFDNRLEKIKNILTYLKEHNHIKTDIVTYEENQKIYPKYMGYISEINPYIDTDLISEEEQFYMTLKFGNFIEILFMKE